MDVHAGLASEEFLSFTNELAWFNIDPPFLGSFNDAKDENIIGGGAEFGVVIGEDRGHFVSVEDPGVVEPGAKVVGGTGVGAGMADAGRGVDGAVEKGEAVAVGCAGGTNGHLLPRSNEAKFDLCSLGTKNRRLRSYIHHDIPNANLGGPLVACSYQSSAHLRPWVLIS